MTTEKGGRPKSADDDRIALRRAEALKLRVSGKTFQEIADTLDIGLATAHLDVRSAMAEYGREAEEDLRAERGLELRRLERAFDLVESVLSGDGDELKLKALDRLMKVQDQRAKLLGLYAPERKEVDAKVAAVSLDELDALKAAALANACNDSPSQPSENEPSS